MSEPELTDQIFFWHDMALEHGRKYNAVKDENAKLRELAKDMFGGYKTAVEIFPSSYTKDVMELAIRHISDRMRELEIEVS